MVNNRSNTQDHTDAKVGQSGEGSFLGSVEFGPVGYETGDPLVHGQHSAGIVNDTQGRLGDSLIAVFDTSRQHSCFVDFPGQEECRKLSQRLKNTLR